MATTFEEIVDVAMSSIQDYKLNKIYNTNIEDYKTITNAFLIRGIPQFYDCKTSLEYDASNSTFLNTLTPMEISILADIWVYYWFEFKVNNVTQFENSMTPRDFKRFSSSENLKQKSAYLDELREKYSQRIVEYCTLTGDWSAWGSGNFGV